MRSSCACRASTEVLEGGDGEAPARVEALRAAGTLRLMFSSASRRSAWKSGWRNVQLWGRVRRGQREEGRRERAYVFAELVVVGVLDLRKDVSAGVGDAA